MVGAAGSNQTAKVSTTKFRFDASTGTMYAVSKSFRIEHPSKPGYTLTYGSLEGPENGVYIRGTSFGNNAIPLPDYWPNLVDYDTISIQLTPTVRFQELFVIGVNNDTILVGSDTPGDISFSYIVFAERIDIEKIVVESNE